MTLTSSFVIVDFNNSNNLEDLDGLTQLLIIYESMYQCSP